MNQTKQLKLNQPSYEDAADIMVINDNMDIIDDFAAVTQQHLSDTSIHVTQAEKDHWNSNTGVEPEDIPDGSITTLKLADGAVTTPKLADNAITNIKIANTTITGSKLANATITQTQLATNAVGTNQLVNGSVTGVKIANLAITNANIANTTIAGSKLANATITQTQLANNAVGTNQIANLAVTGAKITNNTVTADKIANISRLDHSVAIGSSSQATGNSTTAIGSSSQATAQQSTALGCGTQALGTASLAIGDWARATMHQSTAIGSNCESTHGESWTAKTSASQFTTTSNQALLTGTTGTPMAYRSLSVISDKRDKTEITSLKYDTLEFINKIEPKQYKLDFRSDYTRWEEITDREYGGLDNYTKQHRVREIPVYCINDELEFIELWPETDCESDVRSVQDPYRTIIKSVDLKSRKEALEKYKAFYPTIELTDEAIKKVREVKLVRVWLEKDGSKTNNRFHNGLLAQQVKAVADEMGFDFCGFKDHAVNGGDDLYSLTYEEFIAPLIGAIQQLSKKVQILEAEKNRSLIQRLSFKKRAKKRGGDQQTNDESLLE